MNALHGIVYCSQRRGVGMDVGGAVCYISLKFDQGLVSTAKKLADNMKSRLLSLVVLLSVLVYISPLYFHLTDEFPICFIDEFPTGDV
jgi:hypothetical protein